MNNAVTRERPFEYLRRMAGEEYYPEETVKNWYLARAFVLDKLRGIAVGPHDGPLHVVVCEDSPLMLSVVRQIALYAHFPNFLEYDSLENLVCRGRTVITLVSGKEGAEIVSELGKEEYLCNFMKYCKQTVYGSVKNGDSYLDVELEIVHDAVKDCADCLYMSEADVRAFPESRPEEEIYSIDTRKAIFSGRVYTLGSVIDNIPYEDVHSMDRYSRALDTFEYRILHGRGDSRLIGPKWEKDLTAVKNGLSNIMCTDCFEIRELSIKKTCEGYDSLSDKEKQALWEENSETLSLSEHGRWTTERLIMGTDALSTEQWLRYESYYGGRRKAYVKQLKGNPAGPAHIDICSFRDLRRIDPESLKYDSFLMLAIPLILKKIRQ